MPRLGTAGRETGRHSQLGRHGTHTPVQIAQRVSRRAWAGTVLRGDVLRQSGIRPPAGAAAPGCERVAVTSRDPVRADRRRRAEATTRTAGRRAETHERAVPAVRAAGDAVA